MNEKIITDFNEKSNLFNKYFSSTMMKKPIFLTNIFSSQCNPLPNDSKLPETYITETKLSSFNIGDEDTYKIIKTLDIYEAHGHDEVSIRMLKLCDKSIVKPLSIIFNNCKLKNTFPNLLKKANVVPIHKKGEKDPIKNNRCFTFANIWKNFMKDLYLALFLNTLMKMNCLLLISQVFVHSIVV